jgi:hypothetical protein
MDFLESKRNMLDRLPRIYSAFLRHQERTAKKAKLIVISHAINSLNQTAQTGLDCRLGQRIASPASRRPGW